MNRRRRRRRSRSTSRRIVDWLAVAGLIGLVALVTARLERVSTRELGGSAKVVDGDSLEIGATRIRLHGIDAPEFTQTCMRGGASYACGREARRALAALVTPGLQCSGNEIDRYGRLLARCEAGGRDINREMVASGWAVAYGAYEAEERAARQAGSGLWAGTFQRPRDWRAERGDATEPGHGLITRLANWIAQIAGWRASGGD